MFSLFSRKPKLSDADADFMNDIQSSLLSQRTPGSRMVMWIVIAVLAGGLTWAHFARVEEITKGEAKIISKSREQIIQSLEGGILAEMNVREGEEVERGQVLLKIDPTRAQASYREALSKVVGLKATIARLRAEAYNQPLRFDDEQVQKDQTVIEQETKAYQARKRALDDSVSALQRSYELSMREIRLAEPLASRGLLSEVELLRMRRQANEIQSQIVERRNRYQADANSELNKLELELSQTSENLIGRADIMERTTISAPVRGTVKNIRFNTIGGVIQPGEHILEIVPLEDQLLVEAKIRPSDVAFLHPGLPATVKITAYDYAIYGGLKGQVEFISPDTLKDDSKAAAGRPDDTYYRVMVLTETSTLNAGGKALPIIPGMIASVEIRTGEKTILDYLLKPVMKAREAFRER
ncbi:membrane fusion protein, adhesin transport system [Candidatus Pantoea symbiotica]|jgi:adhesin transport system membrane fusion protein|uniref:Membrane fusion protein (MFP) family protein n=1 Tax=Candidatus Pantoea symbiotica TaxID=1884370 RepID=A0A1I3Q969_9GAMM|nr:MULTISPECIES: HlyD family type I secretion periplasmic adaptor subunit [Pantoea]MRS20422.1 HlyD family type I secretion periplasmic adaptor subunit [Enterobacteriaceae bacterium RIT692]MRT26781.1 HlyD family type I secretion periplasmic adaptor subunit [Enterobacteriaceae bacterium RIT697]MRT42190.1 HlyD family type I secretion periplasmic adaptor subunit [Enterobacteriaceae bacterium RIT702]KAJ9433170.1 HlyD family type I secretion periplasmic adaptor subunit [Pantoea sp. YR343]SFJ30169.1 